MPFRILPAHPDLQHLKNEAKALRAAFVRGAEAALERVSLVLGPRSTLKLTEAQRVIAREYGFTNWARLRTHVLAARGIDEAVHEFLTRVMSRDVAAANAVLHAEPRIATTSLHVAATLGFAAEVRRLIAEDASQVRARIGTPAADPLLWLCYSPFHGESPERDAGLEASARALLDAGADANTRDDRYGVPALYAVTGVSNAPAIARILLDAGAAANDGESLFHAAEHFHEESLELLLSYGADVNYVGDWGNTALYFLLRWHDVAREPRVKQGFMWLLEHGADPDVLCAKERESSLHVAARRGQQPGIVRLLLERTRDVNAPRGDGRTAWSLARRGGFDELATLLEEAGAERSVLTAADELMAACGHGDADAARRLASAKLIESLDDADLRLLTTAASEGRDPVVIACLAAGFPIDVTDESGATALHHAAIHGRADLVRELLRRGADIRIEDGEHRSTPLGWAYWGAEHNPDPDGDYEATVGALKDADLAPDV